MDISIPASGIQSDPLWPPGPIGKAGNSAGIDRRKKSSTLYSYLRIPGSLAVRAVKRDVGLCIVWAQRPDNLRTRFDDLVAFDEGAYAFHEDGFAAGQATDDLNEPVG